MKPVHLPYVQCHLLEFICCLSLSADRQFAVVLVWVVETERTTGQDFQNADRDRYKKNIYIYIGAERGLGKIRNVTWISHVYATFFFYYCLCFRSGSWRDVSGLISKVTLVRWAKKEGQNILPCRTELWPHSFPCSKRCAVGRFKILHKQC